MNLPDAGRAVVEIGKLRDYSLNSEHEAGKHKARVFKSALGLTADDAEWLREKILSAAQTGEAVARPDSPFGAHFVVDVLVEREGRTALVRTAWIVELGTDFPRLTSCYVI
jgi:hypothetical protein